MTNIIQIDDAIPRAYQDQDVPAHLAAAHVNVGKFSVAGRIAPKKGRMAAFDGGHYHASMHPTDHVSRIVVTYNFR